MTDASRAKFDAAVGECRWHAAVLAEVLTVLPASFTAADVAKIGSDQRRSLDQAAYRFMKLQDSLGEKVLPGILALTLEPLPPEATFAEKLQRLDRLGVLSSVTSWRLLREVRNSLAHEYPENPALQASDPEDPGPPGAGSATAAQGSGARFGARAPPPRADAAVRPGAVKVGR